MASKTFVEYTDQANGFLRSSNWSNTGASDLAFIAAVENVSNANTVFTTGLADVSSLPASSNQYSLNSTTAVLNFLTSASTGVQLTIGAPDASIFGTDGVTVDASSAKMVVLIAAAIGFL